MKDKALHIMFLLGPLKILVVSQVLTDSQLEMMDKPEQMFLTTVKEDAMDKPAGDHINLSIITHINVYAFLSYFKDVYLRTNN